MIWATADTGLVVAQIAVFETAGATRRTASSNFVQGLLPLVEASVPTLPRVSTQALRLRQLGPDEGSCAGRALYLDRSVEGFDAIGKATET